MPFSFFICLQTLVYNLLLNLGSHFRFVLEALILNDSAYFRTT